MATEINAKLPKNKKFIINRTSNEYKIKGVLSMVRNVDYRQYIFSSHSFRTIFQFGDIYKKMRVLANKFPKNFKWEKLLCVWC